MKLQDLPPEQRGQINFLGDFRRDIDYRQFALVNLPQFRAPPSDAVGTVGPNEKYFVYLGEKPIRGLIPGEAPEWQEVELN